MVPGVAPFCRCGEQAGLLAGLLASRRRRRANMLRLDTTRDSERTRIFPSLGGPSLLDFFFLSIRGGGRLHTAAAAK